MIGILDDSQSCERYWSGTNCKTCSQLGLLRLGRISLELKKAGEQTGLLGDQLEVLILFAQWVKHIF